MSKECQAFTNKFQRLVTSIGPSIMTITDACFGKRLISPDIYDQLLHLVMVDSDKARKLLRNVMISMERDPSCFEKFIAVLEEADYGDIGEELVAELKEIEKMKAMEEPKTKEKSLFVAIKHDTKNIADTEALLTTPYASGVQVVDLCIEKLKLWVREENRFMKRVAFVMTNFGEQMSRSGSSGGIWQLSSAAFQDTKDHMSHRRLPMKYKRLMEIYGIDWMSVTYSDLNKPLYSAIAARLYLANDPVSIPPAKEVAEQAAYWKFNYMRGAGESTSFFTSKVSELES